MLDRTLVTAIGVRAAAAALAIGVLAAGAKAQDGNLGMLWPFERASISHDTSGPRGPVPVTVRVAHNGAKYTHLVGDVSMRFRLRARVNRPHFVRTTHVTTGNPDAAFTKETHAIGPHSASRNLDGHVTLTLPAAAVMDGGGGGIQLGSPPSQQIVDRCNAAFKQPPPADESVGQTSVTVFAKFVAGDGRAGQIGKSTGFPVIAFTTVPVQIVCLSNQEGRVGEVQPQPLNVAVEVDPKGESCPKETKVTAIADFAEKATVRLGVNSETHTSFKTVDTREVTFFGKTWHRAEYTTTFYLDPGQHKFRAKIEDGPHSQWKTVDIDCPPFEVTSAWLKYDVEDKLTCPKEVLETATFHATRPGKLDYVIKHQSGQVADKGQAEVIRWGLQYKAVATRKITTGAFDGEMMAEVVNSPANSGWVRLKVECMEALWGNIDLRDPHGSACPREAEAALSIKTSMAGAVAYSLDCTGDRKWKNVAIAHQTAPGEYIAVATLPFQIKREEQVSCALKSLLEPTPKIIALRGRHYDCIKRSVEPPMGDLVTTPTPPPVQPEPPLVADPPGPTCVGGRLMATSAKPARYSCRCPSGQTAEATGPNSFRCQGRTTVGISCVGGAVRSGQCICPSNMKRVQAGANAWRCTASQPPVQVSCAGGTVRGGLCLCPSNMQRMPAGPNAWRCVRTAQPIRRNITVQPPRLPGGRRR